MNFGDPHTSYSDGDLAYIRYLSHYAMQLFVCVDRIMQYFHHFTSFPDITDNTTFLSYQSHIPDLRATSKNMIGRRYKNHSSDLQETEVLEDRLCGRKDAPINMTNLERVEIW